MLVMRPAAPAPRAAASLPDHSTFSSAHIHGPLPRFLRRARPGRRRTKQSFGSARVNCGGQIDNIKQNTHTQQTYMHTHAFSKTQQRVVLHALAISDKTALCNETLQSPAHPQGLCRAALVETHYSCSEEKKRSGQMRRDNVGARATKPGHRTRYFAHREAAGEDGSALSEAAAS